MSVAGTRWFPAYVGIGSNLDSPTEQVNRAVSELGTVTDCFVTGISSLYRSKPMGPSDQPNYVNAVVALMTTLLPHPLLLELRKIEDAHGRVRGAEHWGPRTLDLDLLVFADRILRDDTLSVPHPGIPQRNFVLLPLNELAPHLDIPGLGTVAALTSAVGEYGIERLE